MYPVHEETGFRKPCGGSGALNCFQWGKFEPGLEQVRRMFTSQGEGGETQVKGALTEGAEKGLGHTVGHRQQRGSGSEDLVLRGPPPILTQPQPSRGNWPAAAESLLSITRVHDYSEISIICSLNSFCLKIN